MYTYVFNWKAYNLSFYVAIDMCKSFIQSLKNGVKIHLIFRVFWKHQFVHEIQN